MGRDRLASAFIYRLTLLVSCGLASASAKPVALRDVMELGEPTLLEYLAPGLDRWVELRAYPTAYGVSGYVRDIDERKRKELERDELLETLRESRERLDLAQAMAHLGSWELDLVDDCLTWSDEVYRIFGLRPDEFGATYEAFLERVHPDDRAAVDAAYTDSLRENRVSYEIEHRVIRADTYEISTVRERAGTSGMAAAGLPAQLALSTTSPNAGRQSGRYGRARGDTAPSTRTPWPGRSRRRPTDGHSPPTRLAPSSSASPVPHR